MTVKFGLRANLLARFVLAGGVNAAFGFGVFSGLVLLGAPGWLAVLGGNLAGLGFNFLTHGGLVFRQLSWRNLPRFTGCYALLLLINTLMLGLLEGLAGGKIIAQALLTIPLSVLSYFLLSRWVFTSKSEGGAE